VSRRNWAFDIAVAMLVGVLGQLEAWAGVGATHQQGPVWAQSVLYAVAAVLLLWRRQHPLGVLGVMTAVYVVEFAAFGSPEGNGVAFAPIVATYSVGRYAAPRRSWLALPLAFVFWLGWMSFDPLNEGGSTAERLGTAVWMSPSIIAWLAGALVRVTLLNREQRAATREQQASRAVAEERNRIARELHDVVGHSVSVMTVQAAAVRRRLRDDQGVEREALETVERVGREAMAEMRRLVGVLREPDGERASLEPSPGLGQVDRLAEQFRSSGLPVSVTVTGDPRELPGGVDLTAYRLLQEGLTNSLRHASGASHAEVVIAYDRDAVRLEVVDDGPGGRRSGTGVSGGVRGSDAVVGDDADATGGNGLVGMRERIAVYGGSLRAGPRADGGFELVAVLPTAASS
jgi:signal transduction histidine kinase